jgi:hypothetical protein
MNTTSKLLFKATAARVSIGLARRRLYVQSNESFSQLGVKFNQRPAPSPPLSQSHQQQQAKSLRFSRLVPFASSQSKPSNDSSKKTGLFGIEGLNTPDGFRALKERAEQRVKVLIDEALDPNHTLAGGGGKRKLVEIFDEISNELCQVADLAEFVRNAHPDPHFRHSADLTFGQISQIVEKLNTNRPLYLMLKESVENAEAATRLDECDKRVSRLFIADFELSGIHLNEKVRRNFVQVNDELINLLMKFQINSQAPATIDSFKNVPPRFSKVLVI